MTISNDRIGDIKLRRYFTVYKEWDGKEVKLLNTYLGEYSDEESAESEAKFRLLGTGREYICVQPETHLGIFLHEGGRFLVRTFRITLAVVLAVCLFSIFWPPGPELLDTPFSQLTLGKVIIGLLKIGAFFWAGLGCIWIAFGAGPSGMRPDPPVRISNKGLEAFQKSMSANRNQQETP